MQCIIVLMLVSTYHTTETQKVKSFLDSVKKRPGVRQLSLQPINSSFVQLCLQNLSACLNLYFECDSLAKKQTKAFYFLISIDNTIIFLL